MASEQKKGCSIKPQEINEFNWYYEYPGRIEVLHEVRDDKGNHIRTDVIKIPKRKLVASLERMNHRRPR